MKKAALRKEVIFARGVMVIESGIAGLARKELWGVGHELVWKYTRRSSKPRGFQIEKHRLFLRVHCIARFSSTQVKKLKLPAHARDSDLAVDGS